MVGLDAHTVLGGVVFDQQLLQKEESLPLLGLLSDLDKAVPVVLGLRSVTVWAHLIGHAVLHHEGLLEDGTAHHLRLHLQLHLQPLAVRLRPEERGVDQLDFIETLQLLQTESHQFSALEGGLDPLLGRLQVSLTEPAELDGHLQQGACQQSALLTFMAKVHLLWDSFSDVNLNSQTSNTQVGWVGLYWSSALTAKNFANSSDNVTSC